MIGPAVQVIQALYLDNHRASRLHREAREEARRLSGDAAAGLSRSETRLAVAKYMLQAPTDHELRKRGQDERSTSRLAFAVAAALAGTGLSIAVAGEASAQQVTPVASDSRSRRHGAAPRAGAAGGADHDPGRGERAAERRRGRRHGDLNGFVPAS